MPLARGVPSVLRGQCAGLDVGLVGDFHDGRAARARDMPPP
jgi:hypothetical protein